jgi:serine protease Do
MVTVFFSDGIRSTGLNFAIPSNMLKKVIEQLHEYGKMQRSWLGISLERIPKDVAIGLGLEKRCGCNIVRVYDNSPAAKGGIQIGDILLSLNDENITEDTNLEYVLSSLPIGVVIPVQVMRDGKEMKFSVTVGSKNDEETDVVSDDEVVIKKNIPSEKIDELNISAANLTPELRRSFDIPDNIVGVVIINAGEWSNKLSTGNVIVKAKFSGITTISALRSVLQELMANKEKTVVLYVFDPKTKVKSYVSVNIKRMNNLVANPVANPVVIASSPQQPPQLPLPKQPPARIIDKIINSGSKVTVPSENVIDTIRAATAPVIR